MGFMDYVQDAKKVVERILSLTREKAFFSFPDSSGLTFPPKTGPVES